MAIFPNCKFLNLVMKCATLLGLFPDQFLFKSHHYLQQGYSIFSKITFAMFTLILLSTYMQLLVIVCAQEINVAELSKNLIITPLFTITAIRQTIMYKSGFKKLLEHILERSEDWMNCYAGNNQLDLIEERSANELNRNIKIYLGMMITTELSYTVRPLLDPATETLIYNSTVLVKSLPLSIWLPFSNEDHFIAAYVSQIIYTIFGSTYDTLGEIVLISVLVYPTTQLKVLKHVLENLEFYHEKILQHSNITKEDAVIVVLRQSIQQHKMIVQYVSDFNELMGTCLFLDFIQSSLHMACVLAEVLTEEVTSMQLVSVIAYLVILNFRLFLSYYYANELTVLNQDLAMAIYQSKWYQHSKKVGFMTLMIIMRNQKGLKYKLGLFGYMSLNKFLSILNAAYSYVMLMCSIK